MIVAQAFQATPREHAPAVVVGLLPGIGAWGALMAKNGLRAAGLGGPGGPFSESLIGEFQKSDTWIHGAFAHRAGVPLHRDDPLGRGRRRHRAAVERRRRLVRLRRGALGDRPDALLPVDVGDTALKLAPAWPFVIGIRGDGAALLHRAVDDGGGGGVTRLRAQGSGLRAQGSSKILECALEGFA